MSYELSYNTHELFSIRPLRESSEECAIQLHHYTPQDEIDKGMFCLFANEKSNPKELLKHSKRSSKIENNNKNNMKSFENDYQARKGKLAILREIMRAIIQRAIEEFKRNYESYYSKSHRRVQLVNLWDKCLIHQYERDEFFEFTKKKGPTFFFQSSFQLLEEENEENLVGPI
ncbi:hypothetical protein Glove_66g78 [Diversispora epigaea]|uniref:Uncharacterized protein n=1 Tax=Diversispora epigaea TaxID=1348612 RepID=A0A397JE36_9GLOM|nr:hypothetical protein Glove_66g78 [Diversispora epigaea]